MGYFSNSTEGGLFIERNCCRCANWMVNKENDTEGCPIMDLHLLYGYELANSKSKAKEMLDFLIDTQGNDIDKWKCSMFLKSKKGR
jgi:hypothetical protein